MKKLLGIVVLGLLFCNIGNAKDNILILECTNKTGKKIFYKLDMETSYIIFQNGTEEQFYYDNNDFYIVKTNQNGEEEWSQTYDGSGGDDWGYSIEQTNDGGYIICGVSETLDGNDNVYLIKTDGQGNVTSTIELPTPTSKRELVKTTNILGQENTTIKNQPLIEIYDDGSVEKKYIIE